MVGLKIKEYLDENGIKYSYLSEKTGMPMNILSPTLNGKRKNECRRVFHDLWNSWIASRNICTRHTRRWLGARNTGGE